VGLEFKVSRTFKIALIVMKTFDSLFFCGQIKKIEMNSGQILWGGSVSI
jgi:hypothetical protein